MIRTLSKDFRVDLLAPYVDDESFNTAHESMASLGGEYIGIKSAKNRSNLLKKRTAQALEYLAYYITGTDREITTYKRNNKKIIKIIKERDYKTVISNYWEGSLYFKDLNKGILKILDPHYAVGENLDVLERIKDNSLRFIFEKRRLGKNLKLEKQVIESSDLLLPLSKRNLEEFRKINPDKPMLLIPDGADLYHYLNYPKIPDPRTILFYGAIGSNQNRRAFWRLFNKIYPKLKDSVPGLSLLVVGSNPPAEIKELDNGKDIIVTGFVEDVRPWIGRAWLCIIPLELGSGFRGRVIELMAMGIPVAGTHNALDSIDMESGVHGYVSDDDERLIHYCTDLLRDNELHNRISKSARKFVKENYSLEATFGKLNDYLKTLVTDGLC